MEYNEMLNRVREAGSEMAPASVAAHAVKGSHRGARAGYWAAAAAVVVMLVPLSLREQTDVAEPTLAEVVNSQVVVSADEGAAVRCFYRSKQLKSNIEKYEKIELM